MDYGVGYWAAHIAFFTVKKAMAAQHSQSQNECLDSVGFLSA